MIGQFLRAIWGPEPLGRFGEIRTITDGVVRQEFAALEGPQWWDWAADLAMASNPPGTHTYFGVLPRVRPGGKAEDTPELTTVLWADVDSKNLPGETLAARKFAALARINEFPLKANVLVDSGRGYHAYWFLKKPEPYVVARPVMAWIADRIGGDKVQDSPRVLRVPGTYNWKEEQPIMARVLRLNEARIYRLDDLVGQLPIERDVRRRGGAFERIEHLPDWLNDLIRDGAPQGTRSETAFRAMVWLFRYGRTEEEIRFIFESTPDGIGEKYAEKSRWDADRWLDTTLRAAASVA